jgi:hypothetical protein
MLVDGMAQDVIFYQFSRLKVGRVDFSYFLSLKTPDKLPRGCARSMFV